MKSSFTKILDNSYNINDTEELELFNINGYFPKEIFKLENLRILKLKGSGLIGSIPTEIGNLKKLNHLDLSNNKLEGPIPISICSLDKIWYIDLTKNCLSGLIAEQFFDFISRKKLPINNIVSGNQLKINIS